MSVILPKSEREKTAVEEPELESFFLPEPFLPEPFLPIELQPDVSLFDLPAYWKNENLALLLKVFAVYLYNWVYVIGI